MDKTNLKCRICWDNKDPKICVIITTKWSTESPKTIKDVILFCVPWMSIEDDSYLCKPCLWQLKFTHGFIERCIETEKILKKQKSKITGDGKLEDIIEKSLNKGNKIQIIFEDPPVTQTGSTSDADDANFNESEEENVEDVEYINTTILEESVMKNRNTTDNINCKIDIPEVANLSEHNYCIKKGTQIIIDLTKSQNDDELSTTTNSKVFEDIQNQSILTESNKALDEREKENRCNLNGNRADPYGEYLLSISGSKESNLTLNQCEDNILTKKKTLGNPRSISNQNQNELTELLDIAPNDIWFLSTFNEMTSTQQDDLVRDGVNILNMSTDPNKKKRTIYLARDLNQGYYRCNKCCILFISRCDYLDHMHLHRKKKIKTPGETVYTCKVCSETFTYDIDFRGHSKNYHGISSPHVCTKCNRRFRTHKLLKDHTEMFKDQEKCVFKCKRCNKEFINQFRLLQHEAYGKDAPCCDYKKCLVCLEKFTKEDYKVHCMEIHPNFLCQECGKSCSTSLTLQTHIKNVHNAVQSMCHECGKILNHSTTLRHHIQAVHGEKKFMCDKCPRQFAVQIYLNKHTKMVHGTSSKEKRLKCHKCGKTFSRQDYLREHERLVHLGIKKFACPICDEAFLRNDYLKRHLGDHEKYIQNSCPVCRKCFRFEERLEHHLSVGHDENGKSLENPQISPRRRRTTNNSKVKYPHKKAVCKICHKVLPFYHLQKHYRAHLNLRVFKCDICGTTLQTKMALTNHAKLHENPNFQFSCNICHAYKSSNFELERHMNEVHNNKKYKCKLCPEAFGRKHLLANHETIVHQEENYKKEVLLKVLQESDINVPEDHQQLNAGDNTKKYVQPADIDKLFRDLVDEQNTFDVVPSSSKDTAVAGKNYKSRGNQPSWNIPVEDNVIVLSNEYRSSEDIEACRILEEENRINDSYISYDE